MLERCSSASEWGLMGEVVKGCTYVQVSVLGKSMGISICAVGGEDRTGVQMLVGRSMQWWEYVELFFDCSHFFQPMGGKVNSWK